MRVLFLNPPFIGRFSREQRSPAITKSGTLYYPMWLAYAAGYTERAGFTIDLVDAPATSLTKEEILLRASQFEPAVAVISTSTPSIDSDIAMAESLHECMPEIRTILVGPHVSACDLDTMERSRRVTAIARREFEETIGEFCCAVRDGSDFSAIRGLTWRSPSGIIQNEERPFVSDLDIFPPVSAIYHRFLDYHNYFSSIARYPQVTIITGRGCPFGCHYCVYPQTQMGRGYRFRSLDAVLDEIRYILQHFPDVKDVFFEDDTLTANKKRCLEFCRRIVDEKVHFSWTANSRADVDAETLAALKKAGCRLLCVGVESGSQDILDRMQKNLSLHHVSEFFRNARSQGILVHGCFMVGNPGETHETMQQTLRFAISLDPDTAQFFPLMVYPGTRTYDWAKENGFLETHDFRQWLTTDGLHNCVVSTPDLSSNELVAFCNAARRRFYFRPRYLINKLYQVIVSKEERRRTLKSAMTFKKYVFRH